MSAVLEAREHQTQELPRISPQWVIVTLKGRGLPTPDLQACKAALAQMPLDQQPQFRDLIARLHRGTDAAADTTTICEWVAEAKAAFEESQSKTASALASAKGGVGIDDQEPRLVAPVKKEPAQSLEERRYERSHHVYASSGAICFESVEAVNPRVGAADEVHHTIQIEMASAITRKKYAWEQKIIFRFTSRELPLFVACLLGWCPRLELGNHGTANDKFLEVRDQSEQGTIFFKLKQGKRVIAVPMAAEEVFAVTAMAIKALGQSAPHLDGQSIMHLVKRAGTLYARAVGVP